MVPGGVGGGSYVRQATQLVPDQARGDKRNLQLMRAESSVRQIRVQGGERLVIYCQTTSVSAAYATPYTANRAGRSYEHVLDGSRELPSNTSKVDVARPLAWQRLLLLLLDYSRA